jgi:hypothetical protein
MRIRHTPIHPEVIRYVRDVNTDVYDPSLASHRRAQLTRIRRILADAAGLSPAERHWLNEHRRRLEDDRPHYPGPGRPTKEAARRMARWRELYELKKDIDEAETALFNGGHDDGSNTR